MNKLSKKHTQRMRSGLVAMTTAAAVLGGGLQDTPASAEHTSRETPTADYNQMAIQKVKSLYTPLGLTFLRLCRDHPTNCTNTSNSRGGRSFSYTDSAKPSEQFDIGFNFDKRNNLTAFYVDRLIMKPVQKTGGPSYLVDNRGYSIINSLYYSPDGANPDGYVAANAAGRAFDTEGYPIANVGKYEINPIGLVMASMATANIAYDTK